MLRPIKRAKPKTFKNQIAMQGLSQPPGLRRYNRKRSTVRMKPAMRRAGLSRRMRWRLALGM